MVTCRVINTSPCSDVVDIVGDGKSEDNKILHPRVSVILELSDKVYKSLISSAIFTVNKI